MFKRILFTVTVLSLSPLCIAGGAAMSGITTDITTAESAANNPAGMAFLPNGRYTTVGGMLAFSSSEFKVKEDKTTVDGGDPDSDYYPVGIPSAYHVRSINDHWRWGLSLFVPSGFGSDNGSDWAGRYYSDSFSLVYVSLSPALSYRINDQWALGMMVNITYNYSESTSRVRNLEPGSGDGKLEFDGDAVGFNGSLSLMYRPTEQTRFGLLYASEATADIEGDVKIKRAGPLLNAALDRSGLGTDFEIEVENIMPARVVGGFHHELTNGHFVTGDVAWIDFSEFSTGEVTIEGGNAVQPEGIYDDLWAFTFGYNIPLDAKRTLQMGALHLTSAVDDEDRTLAMRLDEIWGVGAGLSYQLEESQLDVNVNLLHTGEGKVDTGFSAGRGRVAGKSDHPYVLMFDVSWHL